VNSLLRWFDSTALLSASFPNGFSTTTRTLPIGGNRNFVRFDHSVPDKGEFGQKPDQCPIEWKHKPTLGNAPTL
jgi:hypothetical protein